MEHSAQNSIPSREQPPKAAPRRIRKPLVPPDGEPGGPSLHGLFTGDETTEYIQVFHQAARLAEDPSAFNTQLTRFIAAQSWDFDRHSRMRAALVNLQISDDYDEHTVGIENIDDPTRQGLSLRKLLADSSFRELIREGDRTFLRLHKTIQTLFQVLRFSRGRR